MKFIRLTNYLINPSNISYIKHENNVYHGALNMTQGAGNLFAGFGGYSSNPITIKITKDCLDNDYDKFSEWINENSK